MKSPRFYIFLLITLIIAWSLNTVFAKVGLEYMPPIWMVTMRFMIGTLVAFILLASLKRLRFPKKQDWPFVLSIGILQMSFFQMFFNYGMVFIHAGRASILTYSTPIWVTPFAVLFFGEKITVMKLIGILLGICGILVLFSPNNFNWHDPKTLIGNGLLLSSSLCWAVVMLHTRYGTWHSEPLELLPWQLLIACILPLIIASLKEPTSDIHWNPTLWAILLFSGIIATALGYWLSIVVSKALPVTTTSLSLLSVPVLTLILSDFILAEPLTLNNMIAVSFIVAGLACISLQRKPKVTKSSR